MGDDAWLTIGEPLLEVPLVVLPGAPLCSPEPARVPPGAVVAPFVRPALRVPDALVRAEPFAVAAGLAPVPVDEVAPPPTAPTDAEPPATRFEGAPVGLPAPVAVPPAGATRFDPPPRAGVGAFVAAGGFGDDGGGGEEEGGGGGGGDGDGAACAGEIDGAARAPNAQPSTEPGPGWVAPAPTAA